MDCTIKVTGLTKQFFPSRGIYTALLHPLEKPRPILAIDDITFEVKKGEFIYLVGPNGAGKTTLIKIMSVAVLPTSGRAMVNGYDVVKDESRVKASIGLISGDERSFYWRLTMRQNLDFFAALYNLSAVQARIKIEELANFLDITSYLDRRFQECSTGIKQRLAIARALLNNPSVLFMDEPTKSLDPLTARNLRDFIKDRLVREQKKTVVFVTHNLSEVEDFADRIVIMYQGRIKACGTIPDLRQTINSPQASLEELYGKIINSNSDAVA
ncbi:MAG: ABC transporter ATP-binding protein [Candidatus Omnitrophota bacterium]|jgi:ABC-2 type transport system ATP-binding protein